MYYINLVRPDNSREMFGNEVFATRESAFGFAIDFFPEQTDFEIESIHPEVIKVDERPDCEVISLCDYRQKVKKCS